ncbi:hypothetical protein DV738_g3792, partial [Chaetothyriales sp. CBS 135597]
MKTLVITTALFASTSLAWLQGCEKNDCFNVDGTECGDDRPNPYDCFCSNSTAIEQINACAAASCSETAEQAIYAFIAQICVDKGVTVTYSQQATWSVTSGGFPSQITAAGSPWGGPGVRSSGDWSTWDGRTNAPWSGRGDWGSGVNCDHWTTWTGGWGPWSSWTGTWSGCSTTTATPEPATITTTVTTGGTTQVLTGTTFGVQAVSQTVATSTSLGSASGSTYSNLHHGVAVFAALAGGVFIAMLVL